VAQVHQQYEDNEHVKFLIGLSDLNQPYSCQDWGNVPNGGASQIIHDTSSQIWSLFESSGAVPSTVWIDHNMQIHSMANNTGSWSLTNKIEEMLENCGSLCQESNVMLGDTNFDENINIQDVILIINFILNNSTPEGDEVIAADFNVDGIINILDVIQVVQQILGTTFAESVEWLEENFPELNTKERLSKLNKEQFFSKRKNCKELEKEYKKLLKENKNLKAKIKLLEKIDREKMLMLKNLKETNDKLRIK
jgi:hypothetical protein